jgi:hypothetical protein
VTRSRGTIASKIVVTQLQASVSHQIRPRKQESLVAPDHICACNIIVRVGKRKRVAPLARPADVNEASFRRAFTVHYSRSSLTRHEALTWSGRIEDQSEKRMRRRSAVFWLSNALRWTWKKRCIASSRLFTFEDSAQGV